MALRGVKGPDRVLYGLAALLQSWLPIEIDEYNQQERAQLLLVLPGDELIIEQPLSWRYQIGDQIHNVDFVPGVYQVQEVMQAINVMAGPLTAERFGLHGLILTADQSFRVIDALGNLRPGQIVNYQPVQPVKSLIISGTMPDEDQIKAYPAIVLELTGITPEPDGIVAEYAVAITLGITSPINTSQADYLSAQLMRYYDILYAVLMADDGSLGGLINGFTIDNASIDEATGQYNYLKLLTISLTCRVEED